MADAPGIRFPLWLLIGYLLVSHLRPQDVLPLLGAVKPGLIVTVLLLIYWVVRCRPLIPPNTISRLGVAFLIATLLPLFFVKNTYWFFWTWTGLAVTICVYLLILPRLLADRKSRILVYRVLLICTAFLAFWVLVHGGRGPGGPLRDENDVAMALIVGGSIAYGSRLHMGQRWWSHAVWLVVGMCVAGVIVTGSRGGFLALAATALVSTAVHGRLVRTLLVVGLLSLSVWTLAPESYRAEVSTISDPADRTREDRLYSWGRAWELFLRYPVVGVGVGNAPWRINEVEDEPEAYELRKGRRAIGGRVMHSLYFTLFPETGIVGSSIYLATVLVAMVGLWRVAKVRLLGEGEPEAASSMVERAESADLARGLLIGLSGFLVAGLFISILYYPHGWMLLGLSVVARGLQSNAVGNIRGLRQASRPNRVELNRKC